VTWEQFVPDWSAGDVDAAAVWAACGGQSLTDPEVAVPVDLVTKLAGLCTWLDERGAGLTDRFGSYGLGVLAQRGGIGSARASRLMRCADGWLAVSLPRRDDVAAVPAWLGTTDGEWSSIESALRSLTCADAVERAGLLGLACAVVGERVAHGSGVQIEPLGAAPPAALDGLVVANLASLWAGPLAADILARCGARVMTVESAKRPDGARAWPAFFDELHARCEFVAYDFTDRADQRRLAQLLRDVDIVIEGSRPRALEQMGIDARALTRAGPRVWASITGHGREDPYAHRVGFGHDCAAAGGLVGWVNGEPRFIADAVADPITGLTVAAVVMQLVNNGGRWLVDAPLAAIAAAYS